MISMRCLLILPIERYKFKVLFKTFRIKKSYEFISIVQAHDSYTHCTLLNIKYQFKGRVTTHIIFVFD